MLHGDPLPSLYLDGIMPCLKKKEAELCFGTATQEKNAVYNKLQTQTLVKAFFRDTHAQEIRPPVTFHLV